MSLTIICSLLSSILFIFSVLRYGLRYKELRLNIFGTLTYVNLILKYVIASLLIALIFIFSQNVNIIFLIFLIWIMIFCIYPLSYGIIKLINLKQEPQRIRLEYSIPFINSFETLDISETIVLFGQFFLYGFRIIYNTILSITDFFLLSLSGLLLIVVVLSFGSNYYFNGKLKDFYYQRLLSIINNHLKGEEKQYYLHIAIKLKEKPLVSSEKIPKFFTFFSILLTFIPIISYLFVYS